MNNYLNRKPTIAKQALTVTVRTEIIKATIVLL